MSIRRVAKDSRFADISVHAKSRMDNLLKLTSSFPNVGRCSVKDRPYRNRRLQPKTAFSRLPPVHRVDQEGQERVDLTHSPSGQRMTAICALQPYAASAPDGNNRPFGRSQLSLHASLQGRALLKERLLAATLARLRAVIPLAVSSFFRPPVSNFLAFRPPVSRFFPISSRPGGADGSIGGPARVA